MAVFLRLGFDASMIQKETHGPKSSEVWFGGILFYAPKKRTVQQQNDFMFWITRVTFFVAASNVQNF